MKLKIVISIIAVASLPVLGWIDPELGSAVSATEQSPKKKVETEKPEAQKKQGKGEDAKPSPKPSSGDASGTEKKKTATPKKPTSRPKAKKPAKVDPIRCSSTKELLRTVLTALEKKDTVSLHALRVDFEEYEKVLWPQFVADRPHLAKQKPTFHYFLLETKSKSGVMDIVGEFGGKKLEFVGFDHDRIEDYKTFKLWRSVNVTFKVDGQRTRERLFGAIIERDGKFYLLSYPS